MSATTYNYVSPGVIEVTDANGDTTLLEFTSTGQIARIEDPNNRETLFAYDANDYLSQLTAPGNTVYGYSYDAEGRLLSQTDPAGETVSFTYGANSDAPLTVTDQRGNVTTYSYDTSGNLTGIGYEGGSGESFTYDASGQLTQAVERSGDTFDYAYDAEGRLTQKTFDDGTFEQYGYDADSNLTSIVDVQGGTTAMVYDAEERLTQITYPNGRFLQYAYDSEGRRTQMVDQDGFTVNYAYDSEGRLQELTDASGASIVLYAYDAEGQLNQETNGNGTYTVYGHDDFGQVTSIVNHAPDGSVNSSFAYTYDTLGLQTQAVGPEGTWTYTYDATGQLTRAQLASTDANIANQDLQYVYDAAGNRISTTINGVATSYSSNDLNQYLQVGTAQYTYDLDGNLTQIMDGADVTTYTYNDENRLVGVTDPSGNSWSYEYDAFGSRTATVENGVRTEYLLDPFGVGEVVGEYGPGGLVAKYAQGLGVVGRFSGSSEAFYDSNLIGSTVGLTNASGTYVNEYSYTPYGKNLLKTETVLNPFEYVGQWGGMNESNGLDFMRVRSYSAAQGRFNQSDPIRQKGGLNLYSYTNNRPNTYIDPLGTNPLLPIAGGALAGGAFYYLRQTYCHEEPTVGGFVAAAATGALASLVLPIASTSLAAASALGGIVAAYGFLFQIVTTDPKNWKNLNPFDIFKGFIPNPIPTKSLPFSSDFIWGLGLDAALNNRNICQNHEQQNIENQESADYPGEAAQNTAPRRIDPLVLDLDGDGVELISVEQSSALFDLNADGFRQQTGWVDADDGFLVLDANNDGEINDITELFGDAVTDGFDELATLDSNSDLVIDANDVDFSQLQVWQDLNEDGFTDSGELQTLAQLNIESISLTTTPVDVENEGNLVRSVGSYQLTDGTQREAQSLWFAVDRFNTSYDQPFQLKSEVLFLPTTRGYSGFPDLYISASLDEQLLSLVRDFAVLETQDLDDVSSAIEQILFRWAGVDGVDPSSRGLYINAQQLEFLEAFLGWTGAVNLDDPEDALFIHNAWSTVVQAIGARLLVQGAMRDLFPNTVYNLNTDSLTTNEPLADVLARLATNAPATLDANSARYWSHAIAILDSQEDNFGLTEADYDNQLTATLAVNGWDGYLEELRNPLFGLNAAEQLFGRNGAPSFIDGSGGRDIISGFANGKIIIAAGEGDDSVFATGNNDFLDGEAGVDDVLLSLNAVTSDIVINDYLAGINVPGIITALNFEVFDIRTGSGNDRITQSGLLNGQAWRANDNIDAGDGDDIVSTGLGLTDVARGGLGNDTFVLDYSISDTGTGLSFKRESSASEGVYYEGSRRQLDNHFYFEDRVKAFDFERYDITGTPYVDSITTSDGDDVINAGAGDDSVNPGLGNDHADGGSGFDTITLDLSAQTVDLIVEDYLAGISLPGIKTALNFETFNISTGSGNDRITQSGLLNGQAWRANDNIDAGDGDDIVSTGLGLTDVARGGLGNDTFVLDYSISDTGTGLSFKRESSASEGVYYEGSRRQLDNHFYFEDRVKAFDFERYDITGTPYVDSITTSDGDDVINAGAGDDSVSTGNGNDVIVSVNPEAVLPGFGEIDTLTSGLGSDQFILGDHYWLAYDDGNAATAGETDYANITDFTTGEDTIQLQGSATDYLLDDSSGSETRLYRIKPGSEPNELIAILQSVTGLDLNSSDFTFVLAPSTYVGTNASDAMFGSNESERFYGLEGNDFIYARGGTDELHGGHGNDYLKGDGGGDLIYGGEGIDTARYESSNGAVTINLLTETASGFHANGDQLISIENLIGSRNYGDNLTGDNQNNRIYGLGGDDQLYGLDGNDILQGGLGADVLDGGAKADWAYYHRSSTGVQINLTTGLATGGDAEGDTFISIELLYGSQFDDILIGKSGANTLTGNGGDDTLDGRGGSDSLLGRHGNDTLIGGAGMDRFRYTEAIFGNDTIMDFEDNNDLIDIRGSGLTFGDFVVSQQGLDTLLTVNPDNQVLLKGVDASLIDVSDFLV